MKKNILKFAFALLLLGKSIYTCAQSVTVTPNGITPASTMSYPRLSYESILALSNPQTGDIAYDLTFDCLRVYNGQQWVSVNRSSANKTPIASTIDTPGSKSYDQGQGIATDANGNIYITGFFGDTATFGNITKISESFRCLFVAKYNKSGILQWIQITGGTGQAYALDIGLDTYGNVIITGYFFGTVSFNGSPVTASGTNCFIAKYTNSGSFQWVKTGTGGVYNKLALDNNNNIYITGTFMNTLTVDGITKTSRGYNDLLLAKYDSNGNIKWVQTAGGNLDDGGNHLAIDANQNIYLTGYFSNTAYFNQLTKTSFGASDAFIARYSNDGNIQWVENFGGVGHDYAMSVAVDENNNVYCTGNFLYTVNFKGITKTARGSTDIFILKLKNSRELEWLQTIDGVGTDWVKSMSLSSDNTLYVTGYFTDILVLGNKTRLPVGEQDAFVAKYNHKGNLYWAEIISGSGSEEILDLAIDTNKNIYITGFFRQIAQINNINYTSAGNEDILIARLQM
ncbi:SBBP repeat-containing protein [Emticicia sp. C21]|uniref:SBBP repeat-containing protein n=1 Tax=Emticicia sp. C21 TaxID=2302915 RepID=UPI000E357A91|nr:SBBP repeat-containing protein [Emticicia sp. C21]RFS17807.1 hypothetical protein D0T08_00740 [Emticicia sp. C21]